MRKSISIVIPNYNGVDLLKENLPSVYMALETSAIDNFEIIVTDDFSTDNSIVFLKENYPEIIIVESNKNVGFSGNSNHGIRKASKELVLLLNNDVKLTPGYFISLIPYFKNEKIFGVMGKIVGIGTDKIQDAAKYPDFSFAKINATKNYITIGNDPLPSFFLSGANALVDRKKLLELNGFQELFNPFYYEDVDLGIRAWKKGYKCYYDPNAVCIHPLSATIKKQPPEKVQEVVLRNKILFHYFHLNALQWNFFIFSYLLKSVFYIILFNFRYITAFKRFVSIKGEAEKVKFGLEKQNKVLLPSIKVEIEKEMPKEVVYF